MERVIFSGSRDWRQETPVVDALMELDPHKHIIVHGGQRGLDKLAGETAEAMGFEVEEYLAKWDQYGKAAGGVRNRLMLSRPNVTMVIAFPLPQSKGTWDMVNVAKKAGIKVVVVDPE